MIFLHGLGGNIYHWALIQPEVARFTTACAYDRAGYGWSAPGPRPRSPLQNARELHALLQATHHSGPFIVVGHSWGANGAQVYADQYPAEVAGLVLVDGGVADEAFKICPGSICLPKTAQVGTDFFLGLQPWLFRLGVMRLLGNPQPFGENLRYLSAEQRAAFDAIYAPTQAAETNLAEWQDWDINVGQVGEAGSLAARPLRVLMADTSLPDWAYDGEPEKWKAFDANLRAALLTLSSDAQVTVIPGSDHASLLFHPEQRQFVVATIQALIAGQ